MKQKAVSACMCPRPIGRRWAMCGLCAVASVLMTTQAFAQCPNPNHDCFTPDGPGCSNTACCLAVCAVDSFCCDVGWDSICVDQAFAMCSCGGADAGDCFVADDTPACNDAACCNTVCAADPFCCNTVWDSICADEANDLCGTTACPNPAHDCFTPDGPGCSNEACCEAVCAVDSFCCDVGWDGLCVDQAFEMCSCGGAEAGDCFVADSTPACNDFACCTEVCAVDPFCCDVVWDGICAGEANDLCVGFAECPNPDHNCFTEGTPGCSDQICCEAVCAADSFCCDVEWDGLCVDQASDLCNGCGDPAAGDCFTAHATPFCNNRACCDEVCANDSFCCTVEWDSICANSATILCNCPNPAHSCFTTGSPGCDDDSCCQAVCDQDSFCCTNTWDSLCVSEAFQLCNGCGHPNAGDCFVAHDNADCNNAACCNEVCAIDPFCCNTEWDSQCANEAVTLCNCPNPAHNCFTEGTVGCSDDACCQAVCAVDSFCCTVEWDGVCVDEASDLCDGCGDPAAGDCCTAHPTPFCNIRSCCDLVCAIDSFCCDIEWDSVCVGEAEGFAECGCTDCPVSDHNCFTQGGPGCTDTACCEAVCAIDPFCCDNSWDGQCVEEAFDLCGDPACGAAANHNCVTEGDPGCTDEACCNIVCAEDSFCCDTEWDGICVDEANDLCTTGCGVAATGNCFEADGTPFCNNRPCCEAVCAADSFCCDVSWDGLCAEAAYDVCCPSDLSPVNDPGVCGDGNGNVGPADLGELLANWGPCPGCCADIFPVPGGDNVVGPGDLGQLLSDWGPCP